MANEIITLKGEILNKLTRVNKEFSIAANCQNTLQTMSDTLDDLGVGGSLGAWSLAMDVRDYFTDPASYAKGHYSNLPRFKFTRENDMSYLGLTTQYLTAKSDVTDPMIRLLQKSEQSTGASVGRYDTFIVHLLTHDKGHPVVQFEVYNYSISKLFISAKTGLQPTLSMTPDQNDASTKFILSGPFGRCKINVWQPSVDPSTQFTQNAVRPDGLLNPRDQGTPYIIRSSGSASDTPAIVALQDWSMDYAGGNTDPNAGGNHPYPFKIL